MKQILVTGACGQIGSELVVALGKRFGPEKVIATDIQKPTAMVRKFSHFKYLNVLDAHMTAKLVVENDIDTIFHMAAILSAYGEQNPQMAYEVNLQGLMNILEVARRKSVEKVLAPSTIAVFGSDAPKDKTPDDVALNPSTMYGVTKVAGEKLMQYYHHKYGIDTRSLRYPGIISAETLPGGGTTDVYCRIAEAEMHLVYRTANATAVHVYAGCDQSDSGFGGCPGKPIVPQKLQCSCTFANTRPNH